MSETATQNQGAVVIYSNHELFLHHGDSPGVKLVTKVLEGDNYTLESFYGDCSKSKEQVMFY